MAEEMSVAVTASGKSMAADLRLIGSVFKLRIAVAITLSAFAGLAVMPGQPLPAWQLAALALAVMLASASAGAFNQYVERGSDACMARTRHRPFVTGRLKAGPLWLGIILAALAIAVILAGIGLNWAVAVHVFMGAFIYGVVYTVWLKRRTWLNIVLGGLAGSFAVLAGASAIDPNLALAPIIMAVVLFLWTPPHFWSLAMAFREDYAAANVPMLPVVAGDASAAWAILMHTIALAVLSLLPFWFGMHWIYLTSAALGGLLFLRKSIALVRNPSRCAAMANFHASLLQLALLQIGAIADRVILG
jgi:protoheme IX farnesyltransferase